MSKRFANATEKSTYYRRLNQQRMEIAKRFFTIEAYLSANNVDIWRVLARAVKATQQKRKRQEQKEILKRMKEGGQDNG